MIIKKRSRHKSDNWVNSLINKSQERVKMKRVIVSACLLVAMFSLTSCLNHNMTRFTPVAYTVYVPRKVYVERIIIDSNASLWITNAKQIQSGSNVSIPINDEDLKQISEYLSQYRPDVFSSRKEGAIPITLNISGLDISFGHKIEPAILSWLTLTIIPARVFNSQTLFIYAITNESNPKVGLQMCTMDVIHSSGLCFFPFVWIGYSDAYTKTINKHYMYDADDIWRNHFLTPEFAKQATMAVADLVKKIN